jgi:hypothetical protein
MTHDKPLTKRDTRFALVVLVLQQSNQQKRIVKLLTMTPNTNFNTADYCCNSMSFGSKTGCYSRVHASVVQTKTPTQRNPKRYDLE